MTEAGPTPMMSSIIARAQPPKGRSSSSRYRSSLWMVMQKARAVCEGEALLAKVCTMVAWYHGYQVPLSF